MAAFDYHEAPCHAPGTWQRALASLAAGCTPEPADASALAVWDRNPGIPTAAQLERGMPTKAELVRAQNSLRRRVVTAAVGALDKGEVVGSRTLARRIANMPGIPGVKHTTQLLMALPPEYTLYARNGGQLTKRYITNIGGKPGHFFSRSARNFEPFIATRLEQRRGTLKATVAKRYTAAAGVPELCGP
ncbi:hypothetical protein [Corynebacterium senegalense]|uniref:hypothetical protein n=1 Tax=Corynebacterium senegalense TaxID=2080750 RepID=UPI000E1FE6B5|nr:hypothetical protein [Corynebacterium senegalense]